jgi:hypothetical protein
MSLTCGGGSVKMFREYDSLNFLQSKISQCHAYSLSPSHPFIRQWLAVLLQAFDE